MMTEFHFLTKNLFYIFLDVSNLVSCVYCLTDTESPFCLFVLYVSMYPQTRKRWEVSKTLALWRAKSKPEQACGYSPCSWDLTWGSAEPHGLAAGWTGSSCCPASPSPCHLSPPLPGHHRQSQSGNGEVSPHCRTKLKGRCNCLSRSLEGDNDYNKRLTVILKLDTYIPWCACKHILIQILYIKRYNVIIWIYYYF